MNETVVVPTSLVVVSLATTFKQDIAVLAFVVVNDASATAQFHRRHGHVGARWYNQTKPLNLSTNAWLRLGYGVWTMLQ